MNQLENNLSLCIIVNSTVFVLCFSLAIILLLSLCTLSSFLYFFFISYIYNVDVTKTVSSLAYKIYNNGLSIYSWIFNKSMNSYIIIIEFCMHGGDVHVTSKGVCVCMVLHS